MSLVKPFASRIDWSSLSAKLKPETMASIVSFRRKHKELIKTFQELNDQKVTIDWNAYESLSNQNIVKQAKKAFDAFKPEKIDLKQQLTALEKKETLAVSNFI